MPIVNIAVSGVAIRYRYIHKTKSITSVNNLVVSICHSIIMSSQS